MDNEKLVFSISPLPLNCTKYKAWLSHDVIAIFKKVRIMEENGKSNWLCTWNT